ncbi:MAG: SPASM domain-containing protein [Nanoarchaeota archaeon]
MKTSQFNVLIREKDRSYLVYNTLRGSISRVNPELAKLLKSKDLTPFDTFGEVYKCWELVGLKEHIVGRIDFDGNLEKTSVYGDVLKRNPVNIEQCRNHSYLPACAGGCVCKAQWQSKTYHVAGCGTEKYLLKDKVKVYIETLDLSDKPTIQAGPFRLQKIEGRQKPKMSHCYVLV